MDSKKRCDWVSGGNPLYLQYHDKEWGVPVHDDNKLFEFLLLEGAQAGLSWITVLKKRENYRKAFNNFDPKKIARYDNKKVESLLHNQGIIRNRLKILSAIQNARSFLVVQEEFGSFNEYIWNFMPNSKPLKNKWKKMSQIPARTSDSDLISKDLMKRGFRFVGSTICYSHMQATGMVNDHLTNCFRYSQV